MVEDEKIEIMLSAKGMDTLLLTSIIRNYPHK